MLDLQIYIGRGRRQFSHHLIDENVQLTLALADTKNEGYMLIFMPIPVLILFSLTSKSVDKYPVRKTVRQIQVETPQPRKKYL